MNRDALRIGLLMLALHVAPCALAQSHPFPPVGGSFQTLVPGPGVIPSQAAKNNVRAVAGLDWDRLKSAWDYTQQFGSGGSMIVIRGDWVAFEWNNTSAATGAASVTKSLFSLGAARIFDLSSSGQLGPVVSPDSLVAEFLPSTWNAADARRSEVTLRHLMTMSSGIRPWDDPNNAIYDQGFILGRDIQSTPGTVWSYCSLSADLASIALQSAAGVSVGSILNTDLLGPIGASVTWEQIDGSSATQASTNARLSTRSLARIAYLLLHNGEWSGQQLVSAQNVALVTSWAPQLQTATFAATPGSPFVVPADSPQHFGHLFWTNKGGLGLGPETPQDAYFAHGYGEDLMIVVPSLHMIVVRMGDNPRGSNAVGFRQEFMRRVMQAVDTDPPPPPPPPPVGSGAFLQGGDGTVSMEAEHFSNGISVAGHAWTQIAPAGASAGAALLAPRSEQPRVEYLVNFARSGTHYIYVRAYGTSGSSDSVYVGYDGNWASQYVQMKPLLSWQWEGPIAVNVATTGVHTVALTRRESDAQVDKVVIVPTATLPTGSGPAESARESGGGPPPNIVPTVDITSPSGPTNVVEGTSISFAATATDAEDGDLSASILWTSSRDGPIGQAASLSTAALSIGAHTITASVADSSTAAGSDSMTISVTPPLNDPPNVDITLPADGLSVVEGTSITFAATAADTEDGDLGALIIWSSSRDGLIGQTSSFDTSTLSVGTHVVTAAVSDSNLATGSDAVSVAVTSLTPPPPNDSPIVDIVSPTSSVSVVEGTSIDFAATAVDTEDGELGAHVSWTSSRDGLVGQTASFTTAALSVGTHTITASVADSSLAAGSDSTVITITAQLPPPPPPGAGTFQQAGNGTVSMEAEHFNSSIGTAPSAWIPITPAGASDGAAILAPKSGQPRVEFAVSFSRIGTHYVYVRSYGTSGASDSVHVGFDGNWTSQYVAMKPLLSWQWEGPIAINVGSAGTHTIGLTRRESDAQVDKIVIVPTAAAPTGAGPPESPRL